MQKVFGLCPVPLGATVDEPLQARKVGNKRSLENVENILKLEEREAPDRRRERKGHQERLQEVERGI